MRTGHPAAISPWWIAVICLLLSVSVQCSGVACHIKCKCIWRKGKQTVECPGAGFEKIPHGLDPGVQVLDLTRNNFTILPPNTFLSAGLVNLQRVYLAKCGIEHLDDFSLYRISNLVELDLSDNLISYIPSTAFRHLPLLRHLIFNGNPLTIIPTQAFVELKSLTILEISGCKVDTIAIRAFEGLDKLEVLKLDSNDLQTLHGKAMLPLESLHGITLDGNSWLCDCELRGLRQWLNSKNVPYIPPMCFNPPRLRDKTWTEVNIDDFACAPTFLNTSSAMNVFEGSTVTLECKVGADPIPNIQWLWRDRVIANLSEGISPHQSFIVTEHWEREKLSRLKISSVQEPNAGTYTCLADNIAGKASKNFTLMVSRVPVTGVKIVEEKTEEVKEQEEEKPNAITGMLVGVVAGAVIVLVILSVVLWFCRRRRRSLAQRKRMEGNHKLGNSVNPSLPKETQEDADLKLLAVNPVGKPPRLAGYEEVPTNETDHYDCAVMVDNAISPHVWMVQDHIPLDVEWEQGNNPQMLQHVPHSLIDRSMGARSPIPIPMPVPPEDLHTRLHNELADTLKRKGDRKVIERERGDGSSEMEGMEAEGTKVMFDNMPPEKMSFRPDGNCKTVIFRSDRPCEEKGPDIIDHARRDGSRGDLQDHVDESWNIATNQPWSLYEHPSSYYRPPPQVINIPTTSGSHPGSSAGGTGNAEVSATEV